MTGDELKKELFIPHLSLIAYHSITFHLFYLPLVTLHLSLVTAFIMLGVAFRVFAFITLRCSESPEAKKQRTRMRWKLLIITSLVAAIVGAAGTLGLALWLTGSTRRPAAIDLYVMLTFLVPAASVFFASFFVYRHTARWRKAQALSTALLSIFLTLAMLIASSIYLSPIPEEQGPPAPPPRNTT